MSRNGRRKLPIGEEPAPYDAQSGIITIVPRLDERGKDDDTLAADIAVDKLRLLHRLPMR